MPLFPSRLILLILLALLGACSTTRVQESWRLPDYRPPQPQKILVVALTAREATRKTVETAYANALEQKGYLAIPSMNWIADGTKLNREALEPLVKQNGITTVLVTSVRDVQQSKVYQPATSSLGDNGLFRNIDTYYAYSSDGQHEGGIYTQLTDYLIETNLFSVASRKLSWSVITRTSDTGHLKKKVNEVVKAVLAQAEKDHAL